MYVAPTPFGLLDGIDRQVTLIVKEGEAVDGRLCEVGRFERKETTNRVNKYTFDLGTNDMTTSTEPNPTAGNVHKFVAYRMSDAPVTQVKMKAAPEVPTPETQGDDTPCE
jgi:hypothetical protein